MSGLSEWIESLSESEKLEWSEYTKLLSSELQPLSGDKWIEANGTPEQKLQLYQRQQMEDEQQWNEMMRPIMLKNMGLIEDVDPVTGAKSLRQMTEDEKIAGMTEQEKSDYEVERLQAARAAKAAKGELETPQMILDELGRQREQQQNLASQRLGAKGSMLSTPGIKGRVNQFGAESGVKNAYSYGQEMQGLGLLGQSADYLGGMANRNQNVYGGFPNAGMGILNQAQTASQPYVLGRKLQDEFDTMSRQRGTALYGGLLSAAGTGASMYLSKGMGGK